MGTPTSDSPGSTSTVTCHVGSFQNLEIDSFGSARKVSEVETACRSIIWVQCFHIQLAGQLFAYLIVMAVDCINYCECRSWSCYPHLNVAFYKNVVGY